MKVDLTKSHDFTVGNVALLIASGDDTTATQLRVSSQGIAYLSKVVGSAAIDGLSFRLETWGAGNDYVGQAAAADKEWVNRIFEALKSNWPKPSSSYIDVF